MKNRDVAIAAEVEEIVAAIRALRRNLLRNPAEDAARAGVTGPQVSVLMCLAARGPLTLKDISGILGMSHSTASGIVDRLESRDYVQRTADPVDRRRTRISLSKQAARYASRFDGGPFDRLAAGLKQASGAERKAIRTGLRMLQALIANAGSSGRKPSAQNSR